MTGGSINNKGKGRGITFDKNGGSCAMSVQYIEKGVAPDLDSNKFTNVANDLVKWLILWIRLFLEFLFLLHRVFIIMRYDGIWN